MTVHQLAFTLAAALTVAACDKPGAPPTTAPTTPAQAPTLLPSPPVHKAMMQPLVRRIMMDGVSSLDPVSSCAMLGVRVCDSPVVRSLRITLDGEIKFAQVYVNSPPDMSIGSVRGNVVTIFLTNSAGLMMRGMELQYQGPSRVLGATEASPTFEREMEFWEHWLKDPAAMSQPAK